MREIKFRAYHRKNKIMVYNVPSMIPITELVNIGCNQQDSVIVGYQVDDRCELMQYTNLKDKNGKEIYEGDILQVDEYFNEDLESNLKKIGLVFFQNGEGKLKEVGYFVKIIFLRDGKFWRKDECELRKARWDEAGNYNAQPTTGWKIVGNKFENPELLEAK